VDRASTTASRKVDDRIFLMLFLGRTFTTHLQVCLRTSQPRRRSGAALGRFSDYSLRNVGHRYIPCQTFSANQQFLSVNGGAFGHKVR
jgi:hypothetical protein